MKISIVTPSYNQADFIEKTILSIWRQEGDFELEHIVIDGGSTDQSIAILEKYDRLYQEKRFPFKCNRFHFLWESRPDKGQADALNKGFALSSGDILGWLNSDDLLHENNCLSRVLLAYEKHPAADLIVGNLLMIDEQDAALDAPILINSLNNDQFQKKLKSIVKVCIIGQPSCFFKRNVWENLGIDSYYYCMDWSLWINAYRAGYQFYKIDDYLGCIRQHSNSKTVAAGINKYDEVLSIFRKNHIWCLNRFYYYIYYFFLELKKIPFVGKPFSILIDKAKIIRNALINKYRFY